MKIKTYFRPNGINSSNKVFNALKELYSFISVESEYIVVGEDITEEYFYANIAINWTQSLPFVVIDGQAVGSFVNVTRKFIKDGLISSSSFQSAEGA